MHKNKAIFNKKYLYYLIILIGLIYGCASMRTPEGGPRDKTPPVPLKMEPKNMNTNFMGNKVVIEFDEYFNLTGEFKEFSISPEQEKPPLLKKQQKKLIVSFTILMLTVSSVHAQVKFGLKVKQVSERPFLFKYQEPI